MAWHREIGLEFVDIIVESDSEPVLTSLMEPWSNLRAKQGGPRLTVDKSPVGSSKSHGDVHESQNTRGSC